MKLILRLLWPGNMDFLSDKSWTLEEVDSKFVADSFGSFYLNIRSALARWTKHIVSQEKIHCRSGNAFQS